MTDIIDLNVERERREGPDPSVIRHDEFGRPLYAFIADYARADGRSYSLTFWAYDWDDAQAATEGMSAGVTLTGQLMGEVPA